MRFFNWLFRKKPKPVISPEDCMHLEWGPETKENGWREYCLCCGIKAYGSCQ